MHLFTGDDCPTLFSGDSVDIGAVDSDVVIFDAPTFCGDSLLVFLSDDAEIGGGSPTGAPLPARRLILPQERVNKGVETSRIIAIIALLAAHYNA